MIFRKELEISKKKITSPSEDSIVMMMQRERMPYTGEYETVKPTPSIVDDPSAHVLEYIPY